MSRNVYNPRASYIGNGLVQTYTFPFAIDDASHLLVVEKNRTTGAETQRVRGNVLGGYLSSVTISSGGGGSVTLSAVLPSNRQLLLLQANDAPTQPSQFRDKFSFSLQLFEKAMDYIMGGLQRASWLAQRSIRQNDADTATVDLQLPFPLEANRMLQVAPDGLSFKQGPTPEELQQGISAGADAVAAALAAAGSAQDAADGATAAANSAAAAAISAGDAAASAATLDPALYALSGYSSRFAQVWNSVSLLDTIKQIVQITYAGPLVSLTAAGSTTLREKGTVVSGGILLTANTTKRSNNIGAVRFYKDGGLVNTVGAPNPNGGVQTYTWPGTFSDNVTFSTQVDDVQVGSDGPTTSSDSKTFTFVYPYFVGAGAAGLGAAAIAALTKLVIASTATLQRTIVATAGQKLYFAYPAAYGALTSILDVNSFETLSDWTFSTKSFTANDGSTQSYYCYEFNNAVIAGSYVYTFKR